MRIALCAAAAVGAFLAVRWLAGGREEDGPRPWLESGRSPWLRALLDYRGLTFVEKEQQIDIAGLSLLQLAQALHAEGPLRVSARAAMRYSIAASVFANRSFRFLASESFKSAMLAAEELDEEKGPAALPLLGVPVSVSSCDAEGRERTRAALRALGALPYCTELSAAAESVVRLDNPQGPQLSCCGLVGSASAAHVASGGTFLAAGEDAAGEALLSAHCSAVAAFLPTPSRAHWQAARGGARPALFARTAGDLLFVDGLLCGAAEAEERPLRRFALLSLGDCSPAVSAAVSAAGAALEKAGAEAVTLSAAPAAALLRAWRREQGRGASALLHLRASEEVRRARRALLQEMAALGAGVLLCPSSRHSPGPLVAGLAQADRDHALLLALLGGPVAAVPFSTVPAGDAHDREGVAVSVLVAAAPMQDALALEAAVLLERRSVSLAAERTLGEGTAAEGAFSGFPPTDERRRFLFMRCQKFGNHGCMDREPELMPRPMNM